MFALLRPAAASLVVAALALSPAVLRADHDGT